MTQYFFDLCDGDICSEDSLGIDFGDLASARASALKTARRSIGRDVLEGSIRLHKSISVRTISGGVVHRLAFKDAIEIVSIRSGGHFHFDIVGNPSIADDEGEWVASEAAAREVAIRILSEIIPSRMNDLGGRGAVRVVVRNESGRVVHEVEARSIQRTADTREVKPS